MFTEKFKKIGIIVIAVALGIGTASAAFSGCSRSTDTGQQQHSTP